MLFDAHADILTDMYQEAKKGNINSFKKRHLEEYKRGNITHSIFVNWTNPKSDDSKLFEDIFDYAFTELNSNDDIFKIIKSALDIDLSPNDDKIGVIVGMEGIMQLRDVNHLRELYKRGVRHASLTWNEVNKYAGGLSSESHGLTLLGIEIVQEMERLGMIIDLAHSNALTFQQIIEHTSGPIIISHGNTKHLCDHIRNYTDEQLLKIEERDGVIGICGIPSFVSDISELQTVQYMAKHIDYAINLIGIDHVGIGLDVCYYLSDNEDKNMLDGFNTIGDVTNLLTELRKMGYNDTELEKIQYKNFIRVAKKVLK
jgi:membrane dipeptidase